MRNLPQPNRCLPVALKGIFIRLILKTREPVQNGAKLEDFGVSKLTPAAKPSLELRLSRAIFQ
jgi:hypothetical protein